MAFSVIDINLYGGKNLYQKQIFISPINHFFFPVFSLKILVIATAITVFFALVQKKIFQFILD